MFAVVTRFEPLAPSDTSVICVDTMDLPEAAPTAELEFPPETAGEPFETVKSSSSPHGMRFKSTDWKISELYPLHAMQEKTGDH